MAARMNAGAIAGAGRPAVGDELVLRVASLAFGGDGVARTESGYVVFVAGGFPEMSYTTRFTPGTSLTIRLLILASTS